MESYIVGSWAEHERQHARVSARDLEVLDRMDGTLIPNRRRQAEHYLAVRLSRTAAGASAAGSTTPRTEGDD